MKVRQDGLFFPSKRVHMTLRYDGITQVNLYRGLFRADFELVNRGGTDKRYFAKQISLRRIFTGRTLARRIFARRTFLRLILVGWISIPLGLD